MHTQTEVKAVFSGSPKNKADFQAKIVKVNAHFHLNLPQEGTVPTLKAALKAAEMEQLAKVCRCLHGFAQADLGRLACCNASILLQSDFASCNYRFGLFKTKLLHVHLCRRKVLLQYSTVQYCN